MKTLTRSAFALALLTTPALAQTATTADQPAAQAQSASDAPRVSLGRRGLSGSALGGGSGLLSSGLDVGGEAETDTTSDDAPLNGGLLTDGAMSALGVELEPVEASNKTSSSGLFVTEDALGDAPDVKPLTSAKAD